MRLLRLPLFLIGGAVVAALFVFEVTHLSTMSLWHDEAFSGLLIQFSSVREMLPHIASDVHPPLYYLLLRVWGEVFGSGVAALRGFSLTFGLLSVAMLFYLSREIFRRTDIALAASALFFLSSFHVQYELEARMYTLGVFLLLAATFALLKALRGSQKLLWWTIYGCLAAAALSTHYYVAFTLAAHALFAAYWILRRRSEWKQLWYAGGSALLSTLLFLPWLGVFLRQLRQVEEAYWIPPMNIWSIPATLSKLTSGEAFIQWNAQDTVSTYAALVGITGIVAALFFLFLWRTHTKDKWLLAATLVLPFLLAALVSLKTSLYLDRYFIFTLPFFLLIITAALFELPVLWLRRTALASFLLVSALSYPLHWKVNDLGDKPGMAGAARYLEEKTAPSDEIIVTSSFVFFTLEYYNTTLIRPLLYAPVALEHFSGTALLNEGDTISDFSSVKSKRVWTVDTSGFGNYQQKVPASWTRESEAVFPDAYAHRSDIFVRSYSLP